MKIAILALTILGSVLLGFSLIMVILAGFHVVVFSALATDCVGISFILGIFILVMVVLRCLPHKM